MKVVSVSSMSRPNAIAPGTRLTATFCSIGANTNSPGFMLALKCHTAAGIVTVAGKVFDNIDDARKCAAESQLPVLEKGQRLDDLTLKTATLEVDDGWFIPYQRPFTQGTGPNVPAIPAGITTHVTRNPTAPSVPA